MSNVLFAGINVKPEKGGRTVIKRLFKRDQFDGIFSYFRKIYGKGLVSRGIINISTNQNIPIDANISFLCENDSNNLWYLRGVEDKYVMFNLSSFDVVLKGMSVRTTWYDAWYLNPSFAIETSNDNSSWETIYSEDYSTRLENLLATDTWHFTVHKKCKYIRMRTTRDTNNVQKHGAYCSTFEFFGDIYDPHVLVFNVRQSSCRASNLHAFVFMIFVQK